MVTPQSRIPGIPAWPLQTHGGTVESMDRVDKKVAGKAYNQHRVVIISYYNIRHQTLHWLVTARLMLMCVRTLNPVLVVVVAGADTGLTLVSFSPVLLLPGAGSEWRQ